MRKAILMLLLAMASSIAAAQEVRIGHLEATNDAGINWLFFHCYQSGSFMDCSIVQTLIFVDPKSSTCSVVNDYSESKFSYGEAIQAWTSKEGPTGTCGRVSVGTLAHDPSERRFWIYTERKFNTNPDGMFNGVPCRKFPDETLNYTWKAAANRVSCSVIRNLMN